MLSCTSHVIDRLVMTDWHRGRSDVATALAQCSQLAHASRGNSHARRAYERCRSERHNAQDRERLRQACRASRTGSLHCKFQIASCVQVHFFHRSNRPRPFVPNNELDERYLIHLIRSALHDRAGQDAFAVIRDRIDRRKTGTRLKQQNWISRNWEGRSDRFWRPRCAWRDRAYPWPAFTRGCRQNKWLRLDTIEADSFAQRRG